MSAIPADWRFAVARFHCGRTVKGILRAKGAFALERRKSFSWKNFFSWHWTEPSRCSEKSPWSRSASVRCAEGETMGAADMERTEGLAAIIYPAMMNSIFCVGGHGVLARKIRTPGAKFGILRNFEIEEADTIRLQPCVSPVWDSCIAMVSLEEAGSRARRSVAGKSGQSGFCPNRF